MSLLKKLFGKTTESKTLHKSRDMLLPAKLVNHIVLVANTENKAENEWWEKGGLMDAFSATNPSLIHCAYGCGKYFSIITFSVVSEILTLLSIRRPTTQTGCCLDVTTGIRYLSFFENHRRFFGPLRGPQNDNEV